MSVKVVVDGDTVWQTRFASGDERVAEIAIALQNRRALTLVTDVGRGNYGDRIVFLDAKFVKTRQAMGGQMLSDAHAGTATHGGVTARPGEPATFAVDPNDLDKLAEGLRQAVDQDPGVKERLAAGKVAIATFDLVGIPSSDVARNVAEDLATAMLEKRFRLVERGQLDKLLGELKVQNSGLISPETAKRIGQVTGCSLIVVGSISDRGGFVVVNARILDTESGEGTVGKRVEMRKIPINR